MEDLISIIIPTYGGGQYLPRAIKSVLGQSYSNIEIVVVDDNGVGTLNQLKTEERLFDYLNNKKIHYLCHEKNINGSAARNTGFNYSKGTYIALLDDDDVYYNNNLQTQIDILKSLPSTFALTYCSADIYVGNRKVSVEYATESGLILYEIMMHKVTVSSSSLLIRRSVYEEFGGFDESFQRHQDWEFIARIASSYKIFAVKEVGVRRYLEFRNSPKNVEKRKEYREYYLQKIFPFLSILKERQIKHIIISNRLDIAIQFLKYYGIKAFIFEYRNAHLGFYGIPFIINRILIILFRGRLRRFNFLRLFLRKQAK